MHLGYCLRPFGHHPQAFEHSVTGSAALGFDAIADQVKQLEEAGFDFILLDDDLGERLPSRLRPNAFPFEPTTLIAALATKVDHIGFIGTASTIEHEPYNLARRFASLDNSGDGRVGWNVVAASPDSERDVEFVGVVRSLWDSWEDDAFIYDKLAGRFFLPAKMHVLNHKGSYFSVRGPLNVNRSPQGRPVISNVLTSQSIDLAARYADVVFIREASSGAAQARVLDFQMRLQTHGRTRADVKIFVAVMAYLGDTSQAADALFRNLNPRPVNDFDAETVVGTPAEIAEIVSSLVERLNVDGIELQQPIANRKDYLLFSFAAALRDLTRQGKAVAGSTLRENLGISLPPFPETLQELAR
jgi:N-acetyl-S-(2-succino)cysteine monooxygenase